MKRLLLAFQFLTIVPVRVSGQVTERDIAGSSVFFPLVGAFQGLLMALTALIFAGIVPADIAAGGVLLVLIASNGGFDLDGLADTVDAISVKATGDPEHDRTKRLAVMKDSTIGAMGVIALVMAILLKFIVIGRIISDFPLRAACALFLLVPVYSKWVTVPTMRHGNSAREDGLGRMFLEHMSWTKVAVSTAVVMLLTLSVIYLGSIRMSVMGAAGLCAALVTGFYIFGVLSAGFFRKKFGGLTGDNLGAATEISEILFLGAAYIWLRHSTS